MRRAARALAPILIAAGVVVGAQAPVVAGTFETTAKWKDCDTTKSAISVRATFADPARHYGGGRYMVKKSVKWQYLETYGEWRTADRHNTETSWVQITQPRPRHDLDRCRPHHLALRVPGEVAGRAVA